MNWELATYSPDEASIGVQMIDHDDDFSNILIINAKTGGILQLYPEAESIAYFLPENVNVMPSLMAENVLSTGVDAQMAPISAESAVPAVVVEDVLHTDCAAQINKHEAKQIVACQESGYVQKNLGSLAEALEADENPQSADGIVCCTLHRP